MHDIIQRNIRYVTISNIFSLLCETVRTLYQRDYLQEYDVWRRVNVRVQTDLPCNYDVVML